MKGTSLRLSCSCYSRHAHNLVTVLRGVASCNSPPHTKGMAMAPISLGRVIAGGIVAAIIIAVIAGYIPGVILADQLAAWHRLLADLSPPPDTPMRAVLFSLMSLVFGITGVWIYAAIRPRFGSGARTALLAGFVLWSAGWLTAALGHLALGDYPQYSLTIVPCAAGLAGALLATLAGAALYREPDMPATRPVHVEHAEIVDASVDALWRLVSDFNNVARWHPDVVDSRIETGTGTEPGAVRAIRLRDGTQLKERLLSTSSVDHVYSYSVIEAPLPLRNHRSTVRFDPLDPTRTRVTWTADFDAVAVDPDELASGVRSSVIVAGISGLRAKVHDAGRDHIASRPE